MRPTSRLPSVAAALVWAALSIGAVVALTTETTLMPPLLAVPGYGTVGGILAVRRPRVAFGWLLMAVASVPLLSVLFALSPELQNGIPLTGMAVILVLYPTGKPPGRIWLVPIVGAVVSWLGIGRIGTISLARGFDLDAAVLIACLSLTACAAAPIVRYRRAEGVERAQLQWLGAAIAVTVLTAGMALAGLATGFGPLIGIGAVAMLSLALGIPAAILVAILRHGLYEIDYVLGRTVAYSMVAAVLTVGYLALVAGIGLIVGIWRPAGGDLGVTVPIVATALVSVGFQPVRVRALRRADRLVYGRRRTPYEALAGLKGGSVEELLGQIAQLSAEATAARRAVVWLATGSELRPAAAYPGAAAFPAPVPVGEEVPDTLDGSPALAMRHQGALLGAISLEPAPGEMIGAGDLRLLTDLATHAASTLRAVQEATPLPTGLVTFLMTDIEGSTRLWEEDAVSMGSAIRRHDALVAEGVSGGGGILIKWRGEGDSTFSVFTDPADAVKAAAALRNAIRTEAWPTTVPIAIRAAVHTGEAELRGRDYFGRTVNRCARIRALAQGGQIFLSAATRELVHERLPAPLIIRDLGERPLRDIAEPEHVYELVPVEEREEAERAVAF